jgi:hypothetical protein
MTSQTMLVERLKTGVDGRTCSSGVDKFAEGTPLVIRYIPAKS